VSVPKSVRKGETNVRLRLTLVAVGLEGRKNAANIFFSKV